MDAEISPWVVLLTDAIIPLAVVFLTPLLIALANRAIAAFQEKTKVELSKEQRAAMEQAVHEAIHYAEEQARKALKGDKELDGESKMQAALDYLKAKADVLELDDLTEAQADKLAALVEAKLYRERKELE